MDNDAPQTNPPTQPPSPNRGSSLWIPVAITLGVAGILGGGWAMYRRAASKTNDVALASEPKPVSVVEARAGSYRGSRRYVATTEAWLQAKIGPQLVSAYVDTVLFRPGAVVKKGQVLATLDCRNASAAAQEVAMGARALEAKQGALEKEAARLTAMLDGGFVSANEAEKKQAEAATQQAEILAAKAKLVGSSLEVNDCILRAPFDGEVGERFMDPGAFARPGGAILTVVDRSIIRIAADVPETDFALTNLGTPVKIRLLSSGKTLTAPIVRRMPSADPSTRTVHFEIDITDATRTIPIGTTAELNIDYGEPVRAAELPLVAAAIRGDKATLFTVDGGVAKKRTVAVLGESGGSIFLEASLIGSRVVTEGRGLLNDNDKVKSTEVAAPSAKSNAAPSMAPSASASAAPERAP
ncbi:MAG: efflux RND transporter periplasmic adaptor subunit [Polyangiales bacterium]